ncbi:hypothetical protein CYMTET_55363 [Cymbomonas tetramitiformis]|uniref:Uncharacterized protein n=1 Tax=Cymbomonas tetramitiformis TaxID=36881 RepID=A0AAE0BDJ4_9CHLO|nr:hypothetical protein CYMTET_55363 [Cymbomonas tetramitiformis]
MTPTWMLDEELYVRLPGGLDFNCCSSKQGHHDFLSAFDASYACKDLGVLDLVMGIGVRWGKRTAYLSRRGYVASMITAYG